MAEVTHIETFNCTPEQFFDLVTDYESYPEFLAEVKDVKVLSDENDCKKVEFKVSVVKTITYLNEQREIRPSEVSWQFVKGDIFKNMRGHWKLSADGDKTKAEYFVEANFGMLVPKSMTKTLLSVNLPAMMKAYHKRVEQLYGN